MPVYSQQMFSKLPNATTSIFAIMSGLANKEKAINLSQGFPNFPVAKELTGLVCKAMIDGFNQYAPMQGIIELREAISEKVFSLYNIHYNPETEINITAGATQAIYTIISAFIQKDDEVIIFAPAYDCYDPAVKLNGGKTIEIELEAPDFAVDWNRVKASINDKTKMIIINTPHNPSGTVLSEKDMKTLALLVKETNIIILSDEVYEHIIFDKVKHQSAALFNDLANRTFIVASFGKTFHATGWKMGYCLAPAELMVAFRKTHQFNVFSVNHPMQKALATYIKTPNNYLKLPDFYQAKRDFFLDAIKDSRFSIIPSKGTYFQLLGYENISDESDVNFAIRLTKENKIASIPISVFYNNKIDKKVLRFCFSKNEDTLLQAAEILNTI
ncbi:MAG: methionine aminotransferase [Flavobacteriaceae bacterium]|nr:methionine aminotransferase [Flavobacteriaceae bacterium]